MVCINWYTIIYIGGHDLSIYTKLKQEPIVSSLTSVMYIIINILHLFVLNQQEVIEISELS